MAAAFALVACADAELAPSETERFVAFVNQHEVFDDVDTASLEAEFRAFTAAIQKDFTLGQRRAFAAIRPLADDAEATGQIIAAAQVAIVADGELRQVEEVMLARICRQLGVDPAKH